MSIKNSQSSNYRFTSLKKYFNTKRMVCTSINYDHNSSYLEKKKKEKVKPKKIGKTLAR